MEVKTYMTVFQGVELDAYYRNYVKDAIRRNKPLESKLHVIIVVSNPCNFKRRYALARQFMIRMARDEPDVILYTVELCYGEQQFVLTEKGNPRHLQLRTETPIWHKENLINCGVKLLPSDWKAMAWIDADIEFESTSWATDTLKVLNGHADLVQLFSHAVDMDSNGKTMTVFNSGGYQEEHAVPHALHPNYMHPGFAWACTRNAYEQMQGLYEHAILGSGDNIMMWAMLSSVHISINKENHPNYLKSVYDFQDRCKGLRLSYVPGVIRHYFHGQKKNRKYTERYRILIEHQYEPSDLTKDDSGVLVPTDKCDKEMLQEIINYFKDRNEDEI